MHMTLPTLMLVLGAKTSAKYALMRPPTEWPTRMTSVGASCGKAKLAHFKKRIETELAHAVLNSAHVRF